MKELTTLTKRELRTIISAIQNLNEVIECATGARDGEFDLDKINDYPILSNLFYNAIEVSLELFQTLENQ